jgi:hypothetical protein
MAGEQTKFTTSFIPKKPVTPTVAGYKTSSNYLTIITVAIFLGTLAFGAGVFAYKLTIEQQIISQIDQLKKAKAEFDINFIKEATRLNTKIIAVKTLIDNHQAPSAVLDLLQETTLSTVRFNNLKYTTDKAKGTITIDASGVGTGYPSIVLQSDEFGKTGALKDVVFSSVQPNENGLVTFSFKSGIDPALVLYRKTLASGESVNEEQIVSFNNIFE